MPRRATRQREPAIELTTVQQRVLAVPEQYDVFLGGARGGGKSYAMALLALRHAEQYGQRARALYIRKSYPSIADFEGICREVFATAYGKTARYSRSTKTWSFPNGASFELGQLEDPSDYPKYQGRSFTLLMIDEAGEYASPDLLDRLRSNLRAPKGTPVRMVMGANPGGPGHGWLSRRYVFQPAAPWTPFHEEQSGREWVYGPSTFKNNQHLDIAQYEQQLRSSCPADPELLKAWIDGDWSVARGAYFGPVISENRNAIDPWPELPQYCNFPANELRRMPLAQRVAYDAAGAGWRTYLSHDYGSSAPSVTYIVAESPGAEGPDGRFYPRGSLILVDELATVDPNDPTKGLGFTADAQAAAITDWCARWGVAAEGVADDAIFSDHGSASGTIADEFRRAGVHFTRARKGDRIGGWSVMRRLLADAGKPDVPGLYISRACRYWWETVPFLGRDMRRVEDVDTKSPDHAADATRYAVTGRPASTTVKRLRG